MKAWLLKSFLPLFALSLDVLAADDRDPAGETAYYKLDDSSSRTSRVINDGELDSVVGDRQFNLAGDPSYPVDLKYKLKMDVIGTQRGTETIDIPEEYFSEEFLVKLREEKNYTAPKFKVKHNGFADTETMNGRRYRRCDKLHIYDIDASALPNLKAMLKKLALAQAAAEGRTLVGSDSIEDLKIDTLIKYGVPVLGAVKIDISGKYKGMRIKAGTDYDP